MWDYPMEHKHKQKMIDLVELQLGKDFNSNIIEEVVQHMEECPDCKIYVDSVQQTIKLYRTTEKEQSIPVEVSDRLFKVLNLQHKDDA